MFPHAAPHVTLVQPQMPAVPPPPHVAGAVQSVLLPHPHVPPDSHAAPVVAAEQVTHAPPAGPQAGPVLPGWQLVPSQHSPLHVSGPVQVVLHVFDAEQAFPTGQSPAAAQPHVPPSWHTWPMACVEQSVHTPPVVPQSVPPAAPVWQVPLARLQHPVLHASVTPATTHVPLHPCVVTLHAWSAGQSVVVLQPQAPATHWLLPVHGPQAAPLVPQAWFEVAVMHVPVASQQPLGQLVGVHCTLASVPPPSPAPPSPVAPSPASSLLESEEPSVVASPAGVPSDVASWAPSWSASAVAPPSPVAESEDTLASAST
jgi:hypothetical protein